MDIYILVPAYFIIINVCSFIIYGIDKNRAVHNRWRISEAALLTAAVIGGSIGAWCGMMVWHHKTRHLKFKYGIPVIFMLQLAVSVLFLMHLK